MKYIKFSLDNQHLIETLEGAQIFLESLINNEDEDKYTIQVIEMSEDEFVALPEFDGF